MKKKPLKININLYNKNLRVSLDSELLPEPLQKVVHFSLGNQCLSKRKLKDFNREQKKKFTQSITKAYQLFHEQNKFNQRYKTFRNSQKSQSAYSLKSNKFSTRSDKQENQFSHRLSFNGGFKFPKKSIKKYSYSLHNFQNEFNNKQIKENKQKLFYIEGIKIQKNKQNSKNYSQLNQEHKLSQKNHKNNITHLINKQKVSSKSVVKNNNDKKMILLQQDQQDGQVQNQNKFLSIRSFYSNIIDDYCRRKMYENQNYTNNKRSNSKLKKRNFELYNKQKNLIKKKKQKGFQYGTPEKTKKNNQNQKQNLKKFFFLTCS